MEWSRTAGTLIISYLCTHAIPHFLVDVIDIKVSIQNIGTIVIAESFLLSAMISAPEITMLPPQNGAGADFLLAGRILLPAVFHMIAYDISGKHYWYFLFTGA